MSASGRFEPTVDNVLDLLLGRRRECLFNKLGASEVADDAINSCKTDILSVLFSTGLGASKHILQPLVFLADTDFCSEFAGVRERQTSRKVASDNVIRSLRDQTRQGVQVRGVGDGDLLREGAWCKSGDVPCNVKERQMLGDLLG